MADPSRNYAEFQNLGPEHISSTVAEKQYAPPPAVVPVASISDMPSSKSKEDSDGFPEVAEFPSDGLRKHRRVCGLALRTAIIIVLIALLAVLAIVLGVVLGTKHSSQKCKLISNYFAMNCH
jgi:hypothetical protein